MEPDLRNAPLPPDWERRKAERVRKNEAAFKHHNERRKAFEEAVAGADDLIPFVCECGDAGCYDAILLTIAQLDEVHASPRRYAVKPMHVMPDCERVLQQRDLYWLVEKYAPGEARGERAATGSRAAASP